MQCEVLIGKEFADATIAYIENAQRSIEIIAYDWRWYPSQIGSKIQKLNTALILASKRGVLVRALTNTHEAVSALQHQAIDVHIWENPRTLHTKLILIDNYVAILGSHNLTMNALELNQEVSIVVEDKGAIAKLKNYWDQLWPL